MLALSKIRFLKVIILMVMLLNIYAWTGQGENVLSEQYEYDKEGRLICRVMPDGSRIKYEYNEHGLLTKISYSNSTVCYEYDANGNRIWVKCL